MLKKKKKKDKGLLSDAFLCCSAWHVVCLQMVQKSIQRQGEQTKDTSSFICATVTQKLVRSSVWAM